MAGRFFMVIDAKTVVLDIVLVVILSGKVSRPVRTLSSVTEEVARLSFSTGCVPMHRIDQRVSRLKGSVGRLSRALRRAVSRLGATGIDLRRSVRGGRRVSRVEGRFLSGISRRLGAPLTLVRKCTRKLGRYVGSSTRDHSFCYSIVVSRSRGVGRVMGRLLALGRLRFNGSAIRVAQFSVARLVSNIVRSTSVVTTRGRIGVRFCERNPMCI